jgi:probable O-glycosylation ligase (exosortase A-associated)
MMVLRTRQHIVALAWTLVIALGFYGVKGGIFTLFTGGHYRVWGPPDSYIEGNNELALALIVIIPLMRFVQLNTARRWVRHLLGVAMVLSAVAAIGSQSRGALVGIAAMVVVMWWRSEKKFVSGVALLGLGVAIIAFMPDMWSMRMDTILDYQDDASAMGRINAGWMAWNLASANFFGGGFAIYNAGVFALYAPVPDDVHAAHSIYFQILGEHGFVGLGLYLLLWAMVWFSAGRLRRVGKALPETQWLSDLGAMCQVSLAGFAVGGAFLSLAYFDLPYNVLLLVVIGSRWMDSKAWLREAKPAPGVVAASTGDATARVQDARPC